MEAVNLQHICKRLESAIVSRALKKIIPFERYIYGNNGIQNDTTYPYQEDVPHVGIYPCRSNLTKKVATDSGYWRIRPGNETLLRDVIAAKGPVAAALYGSMDSFYYYWDGIYDDPSCPSGTTHSLLIVGYGTENGVVSHDEAHCKV